MVATKFTARNSLPVSLSLMLVAIYIYRPQRSRGKVCFHRHLSFCPWGEGGVWQTPPGHTSPWADPSGRPLQADIPWADTPPPRQTPLPSTCLDTHLPCPVHAGIHIPVSSTCWDIPSPGRPLQRTVRTLLECFLVCFC